MSGTASQGKHAFGSYVEFSTDNNTWSSHLQIRMVNVPARKRNAAKGTHLESPDGYKENRPGIKEVPAFKGTLIFHADQYQSLETYFEAGTNLYWRFSEPLEQNQSTPDRTIVQGFLTELGDRKLDPDDSEVELFDIEITHWGGKPQFTPGS
jgi:hypothetical protein